MSADLPIGSVVAWCGAKASIPEGWLYCDGQIVSQSQYKKLFNVISHSFGNPPMPDGNYDPQTQFFLPDFRGTFLRGVDDGSGRDPDSGDRCDMQNPGTQAKPGPKVGPLVGSVQYDELRKHTHSYWQFNGKGLAGGSYWGEQQSETGATGGNETRPINAYVFFIIKAN